MPELNRLGVTLETPPPEQPTPDSTPSTTTTTNIDTTVEGKSADAATEPETQASKSTTSSEGIPSDLPPIRPMKPQPQPKPQPIKPPHPSPAPPSPRAAGGGRRQRVRLPNYAIVKFHVDQTTTIIETRNLLRMYMQVDIVVGFQPKVNYYGKFLDTTLLEFHDTFRAAKESEKAMHPSTTDTEGETSARHTQDDDDSDVNDLPHELPDLEEDGGVNEYMGPNETPDKAKQMPRPDVLGAPKTKTLGCRPGQRKKPVKKVNTIFIQYLLLMY